MPPIPDPKVRLLLSAPLAAMTAVLARTPDGQETGMASAVPRVLIATFACAVIAHVASSADDGKGGLRNVVAGLAMAAASAMSLSFGASLSVAMAFAGGFDVLACIAAAFALAIMTAAIFILSYVVATIVGVRMRTAAAIMLLQIVPLTACISVPIDIPAYACAAAAAAVAFHAASRMRASGKK